MSSLLTPLQLLGAEETLLILSLLDTKERLVTVGSVRERFSSSLPLTRSQVCKEWRSLRSDPALWRDVVISTPAFSDYGLTKFMSGQFLPLPTGLAVVRSLSIFSDKSFSAIALKNALRTCGCEEKKGFSVRSASSARCTKLAVVSAVPLSLTRVPSFSSQPWAGVADHLRRSVDRRNAK